MTVLGGVGALLWALLIGVLLGRRSGRSAERARCLSLASQSWSRPNAAGKVVLSPSARRIYHSIDAGHDELISEDDFFDEGKSKSL